MADAADGYPFLQAAHVALSEARKWIDRYGEVSPVPFEADTSLVVLEWRMVAYTDIID